MRFQSVTQKYLLSIHYVSELQNAVLEIYLYIFSNRQKNVNCSYCVNTTGVQKTHASFKI